MSVLEARAGIVRDEVATIAQVSQERGTTSIIDAGTLIRDFPSPDSARRCVAVEKTYGRIIEVSYGAAAIGANIWAIRELASGARKRDGRRILKGLGLAAAGLALKEMSASGGKLVDGSIRAEAALRHPQIFGRTIFERKPHHNHKKK